VGEASARGSSKNRGVVKTKNKNEKHSGSEETRQVSSEKEAREAGKKTRVWAKEGEDARC
jgi:hypothetical protein